MTSPFDSIRINSIELTNRIAMAPIKTGYGTTTGQVTDQLIGFFRRRAEGGAGLIISEPMYIDKRGQEHPKQLGIDSDDKIEGLQRLVGAVHHGGARVFAHLNHAGRAANPKAAGGPPEAPSKVICARSGVEPEVMTESRIVELMRLFADAAQRAEECGFDGVELQFGLGYLVSQFLSPATNLRTDNFGGDDARRRGFARGVVSKVREAVGQNFPVGVRISASEKLPGGLEIEDAKILAGRAEAWGVDLIHVATGSSCDSPPWYFQHMALPPRVNEGLAAEIRKGVRIPVMAAGRLGDPPRIREVLASEMIDMVALGRPLLADPDLPNKMLEGRDDEVLLCGHCLQGCLANVTAGRGIGCNFNPMVGHEIEMVTPANRPKHVVVVGGGPAGMQAALTAHSRGHRVTLFEKSQLGGQFELASHPPGKQRMEQPLRSLVAKMRRSGITLRVAEEATRAKLESLHPDVVILATGSRPALPDIPGLDDPVTGEEVLAETRESGNRVLVLGGGMVGAETAEYLARRGRQVVIVEVLEQIANDMDPISRKMLLGRLASLPVEVHTTTKLVRVEDRHAFVEQGKEEHDLGEFDSVIVATGNRPYLPLSQELLRAGFDVRIVGDAVKAGTVRDAISSANRVGMSV